MNLKKLLGLRIKELRKQKNIKQEKLAEMINIATRNLSNIETGRCFPSPENIEKIACAFNCRIKELFDFEHEQESADLIDEINTRLKNFDQRGLKDLYKITRALSN